MTRYQLETKLNLLYFSLSQCNRRHEGVLAQQLLQSIKLVEQQLHQLELGRAA